MAKTTIKINLPAKITADDYHEFDYAERYYKDIGLKVNVEEIACISGNYTAVVYLKKDAAYRALVKEIKEEEASEEEEKSICCPKCGK